MSKLRRRARGNTNVKNKGGNQRDFIDSRKKASARVQKRDAFTPDLLKTPVQKEGAPRTKEERKLRL